MQTPVCPEGTVPKTTNLKTDPSHPAGFRPEVASLNTFSVYAKSEKGRSRFFFFVTEQNFTRKAIGPHLNPRSNTSLAASYSVVLRQAIEQLVPLLEALVTYAISGGIMT